MSCTKLITTKQESVLWSVIQSRHMSAIFVGSCQCLSLVAASGDPVVCTDDINKNLWALLTALVIDLLGIPLVAVTTNSLYSKLTSTDTQGTTHPVQSLVALLSLCTEWICIKLTIYSNSNQLLCNTALQ